MSCIINNNLKNIRLTISFRNKSELMKLEQFVVFHMVEEQYEKNSYINSLKKNEGERNRDLLKN